MSKSGPESSEPLPVWVDECRADLMPEDKVVLINLVYGCCDPCLPAENQDSLRVPATSLRISNTHGTP